MPLPHVVARLNKRFTNRFIEPLARRSPGFADVHHVGRRSAVSYTTPVNVFDLDGDALVVLTYGERADWLRNLRQGTGRLEYAGTVALIESVDVVGRDVAWPALPWFVRVALRCLRVRQFARLSTSDEIDSSSP